MSFGVEWGELEADYPFGGDGVAVDLGGSKIPTMRGLQGLVGEISAGAGGEEFGGSDVAGGVDTELDGNVNGATDGGARFGRNIGHDLLEDFALDYGASARFRNGLHAGRVEDAGEGCGSGRGSAWRMLIAGFFQRWRCLRWAGRRRR